MERDVGYKYYIFCYNAIAEGFFNGFIEINKWQWHYAHVEQSYKSEWSTFEYNRNNSVNNISFWAISQPSKMDVLGY